MVPLPPHNDHRPNKLMNRLNHATGEINPFLLAFVIGLVVLYVTCLVGLAFRVPAAYRSDCTVTSTTPTTSMPQQGRARGLPL